MKIHRSLSAGILLGLSILGASAQQKTSTSVQYTADGVDGFVLAAQQQIHQQRDIWTLYKADLVRAVYQNKPDTPASEVISGLIQLDRKKDEIMKNLHRQAPSPTYQHLLSTAGETLMGDLMKSGGKATSLGTITGGGKLLLKLGAQAFDDVMLTPQARGKAQSELAQIYQSLNRGPGSWAMTLYQLADVTLNSDQAAVVFREVFEREFMAHPRDSFEENISKNPVLAQLIASNEKLDQVLKLVAKHRSGEDEGLEKQLKALLAKGVGQELNSVTEKTGQILESINEIEKKLADQNKVEAKRLAQELEARDFQAGIAGSRSIVFLSTTLLSKFDPIEAQRLSIIGNAGLDLLQNVDEWSKMMKDASSSDFGKTMGTVALSGNVVGLALNVFGMLNQSNAGPTPDQVILEQISKLSEQMASFEKNMNARFDRIDARLEQIHKDMIQGFHDISKEIGSLREDTRRGFQRVQDIATSNHKKLSNIEDQLVDIEFRIKRYLQTDTNIEFHKQVLASAYYRDRNPGTLIPLGGGGKGGLIDQLDSFYIRGAIESTEALHVNDIPLKDGKLDLDELLSSERVNRNLKNELHENYPYLFTLADLLSPDRNVKERHFANSLIWRTSADAYWKLLSDWPEYYSLLSRGQLSKSGRDSPNSTTALGQLNELIRTGEAIQIASHELVSENEPGKGRKARTVVFDQLIQRYKDSLTHFKSTVATLDSERTRVASKEIFTPKDGLAPYSIWQDSTQKVNGHIKIATEPGNLIRPCGKSGVQLQFKDGMVGPEIIPDRIALAVATGVGFVSACYEFHYREYDWVNGGYQGWQPHGDWERQDQRRNGDYGILVHFNFHLNHSSEATHRVATLRKILVNECIFARDHYRRNVGQPNFEQRHEDRLNCMDGNEAACIRGVTDTLNASQKPVTEDYTIIHTTPLAVPMAQETASEAEQKNMEFETQLKSALDQRLEQIRKVHVAELRALFCTGEQLTSDFVTPQMAAQMEHDRHWLASGKRLIEVYTRLGLPVSIIENDRLRSSLYGRDSLMNERDYLFGNRIPLPNGKSVRDGVLCMGEEKEWDMDSLSSPITQIESAVEGYRLALQDAFTQRTDRTGAYEPETDPVLGDTLGRLKLLQSVILNDNTYRDGRAPVDDVRQRIRMDLKNAVFKR